MILKFKTFAFTLRPLNGVTDRHIEKLCTYLSKNAEYYKVITEKTGDQRHIHSAFVMKKETARGDIAIYLKRMYKELTPEEMKVMLQGLKVWYNRDFLDYLDKGDDTVVVVENLPEVATLDALFPPPPSTLADTRKLSNQAMLTELEKLWFEHTLPGHAKNTENARNFLWDMMYNKRLIGVMLDDRRIDQVARALVRWMMKATTCTVMNPPYMMEEGEDVHPKIYH